MPERIRVLIVDDHAMVRRGMPDFLDLHRDLDVVGEADDGLAALDATAASRPDVVVMDLMMPGLDGIAATAELKARHRGVEVVAITSFIEESRVTATIEAGASGFLLKDAEADDLAAAIRGAFTGEVYLDPAVAGIVARRVRTGGGPPNGDRRADAALSLLTARERDVLACVAQGMSNRAIADEPGKAALFAVEDRIERAP